MKFVSRSDLGWPASAAADLPTAEGVKVHYEGTHVSISGHDGCWQEWRDIRASHLANTAEGYVDVAYNFGVCGHGYVFEGRGVRKKTGANGNSALNSAHYSVVAFLGDSGDTQPTPDMIQGIKDAIALLRANGAGNEIKGHRDGYATSCPGEPLYALVHGGNLEPGGAVPSPPPSPAPTPNHPWPGLYAKLGSSGDYVRTIQSRLKQRGWAIGVDGQFGPQTDKVVRAFQRDKSLTADGIVGRNTWNALWNSPIT